MQPNTSFDITALSDQSYACKNAMAEAIKQTLELISLAEAVYDQEPEVGVSPIGKHVRHIVDHLWAFRKGVEDGFINYNLRHRNIELENKSSLAIDALAAFLSWLETSTFRDEDVRVESEVAISQEVSVSLSSKYLRELVFLISHTYHHLAYANLIAKLMGVDTPAHIGVAPATATFLRESKTLSEFSEA